MADDPTADLLADLQRRIRALETAPRASYTTIRAGTMAFRGVDAEHAAIDISGSRTGPDVGAVIYTEDDTIRAYFGTLGDGAFATLRLDNPDKSGTVFRWDSDTGLVGPYGIAPWQKNPTQPISSVGIAQTTSGAFEIGYRSLAYVTTKRLALEYYVNIGGATSAEIAVTALAYYDDRPTATPASAQTVFTRTVSSSSSYADEGDIPNAIWSPAASPVGTLINLEFSARVSAGAGTVQWAPVLPGQFK